MSPEDVQKEIEQLEQRFAENSKGLVFAHLADAYRKAGEFGKAEGLILHGLKNHPNYISAYNVLGRVYLDSERFPEAHEQFSKVLELDPHNLIALRALGDLAVRDGEVSAARSWYERMLQVDPRNEEASEELRKLEAGAGEASVPVEAVEEAPVARSEPEPAPAPEESKPVLDESAESRGLEIVGSPGLETAGHREDRQPAAEGWDEEDLDFGVGEEESEDSVEELEGFLSDRDLAGLAGAVDELEEWSGLEKLGTAGGPAAAGPHEAEEGALDDEGMPSEPARSEGSRERRSEFELGDMDDWTPGFITEDEVQRANEGIGEVDDDFNFDLLGADDAAGDEKDSTEAALPEELHEEGLITETMAELYARQGFYQDALKVYEQLAEVRPNDDRIRARIAELRAEIGGEDSSLSADDELAALLELTEEAAIEAEVNEAASWDEELEWAEPQEPVADSTAAPTVPSGAESTREAVGEEDFEFEDEAPVAGLEHLDPFAASFDSFAKRDGVEQVAGSTLIPREAEVQAGAAPEAEAAPEPEPAAPPELEVAAELVEPLHAAADADEDEVESLIDVVPAAADEGAGEPTAEAALRLDSLEEQPEPSFAAEEGEVEGLAPLEGAAAPMESALGYEPPSPPESIEPASAESTPPRGEEPEITIEEYLAGLLAHVPGTGSSSRPEPEAVVEETKPAEPGDATGGEDLEEFQEWLRSLKR